MKLSAERLGADCVNNRGPGARTTRGGCIAVDSALREKMGRAHASSHAPGVKLRRHQDLRPKKPPEQQQPPPPEPRAARQRPPLPRTSHRPGSRSTTPRRPQHVASNPPRANRATAWAKRAAPRLCPARLPRSSTSACPTPSTSHPRTSSCSLRRRRRIADHVGTQKWDWYPRSRLHIKGLGPQRGSSFRPTWRTIERTSEESRGRNGVTGRRQRVPGAPEGNTGRRDRPRTEGAGRHKQQNKLLFVDTATNLFGSDHAKTATTLVTDRMADALPRADGKPSSAGVSNQRFSRDPRPKPSLATKDTLATSSDRSVAPLPPDGPHAPRPYNTNIRTDHGW